MQIRLPQSDGQIDTYVLKAAPLRTGVQSIPFNRTVYAAAHVVIDPLATSDPWDASPRVDWEATLAFRSHLYQLGFKVAEAMDTAQRGMGVDWPVARELIKRSLRHAKQVGGDLACGVGTDQLLPGPQVSLTDVEAAYREQLAVVEAEGGRTILMASRALAQCARGPDDYLALYGRLLKDVSQPVVLHWLGEMFDPALRGYWGSTDTPAALDTVVELIEAHADKVEGIKVSLLDAQWEIALRRRLPAGVKMYTGDDFNYAELIAGDDSGISMACWASSTRSRRWLHWPCRNSRPGGWTGIAHCWIPRWHCHARSSGPDAALQGRRGLPGLAQRTPGPLLDGRRPAVGPRCGSLRTRLRTCRCLCGSCRTRNSHVFA